MLNFAHKLNHKVLQSYVELKSMREGFGLGLVKAAAANKAVVVLSADLSESTGLGQFIKKFPDRYIEIGVAEQNLCGVASGMAAMGKIPFMASYAVFSPGRNWEQIRTTICYNDRPVKIIGSHAGLNVGPDGGSHQALEDIAMMRVLPNMTVISPCDAYEAEKAAVAMAKINTPAYVRLAREKSPLITTEDTPFKIGKANVIFKHGGKKADVGIIATGIMTHKALEAAQKLENKGRNVIVLNVSTIKPLDEEAIIKLAKESGAIVTVEDHQQNGGLGGAVAECLARHCPVPMEFVAVQDKFGQSGSSEELFDYYKMNSKHIALAAEKVILRK